LSYYLSNTVSGPFDEVIERTTAALAEEGFGVLTDIDIKATLRKKLDVDFRPYRILGACNPKMAKTMIDETPEIGTLLPCTIVAREAAGKTIIDFMNPEPVLGLAGSAAADAVATEATAKLKAVVAALEEKY
jgi:uncharacterized protein (DUF302 family)